MPVHVGDFAGMGHNEIAARFHFIAHENVEHLNRGGQVFAVNPHLSTLALQRVRQNDLPFGHRRIRGLNSDENLTGNSI